MAGRCLLNSGGHWPTPCFEGARHESDVLTMPMRMDCKQFESRSYANGETVRKCNLDLAPEAPWRCPDNCPSFERRMADVNWSHGSLVVPPTPPEPSGEGIAELLDSAEDVVNAAAAGIMADLNAEQRRSGPWRRLTNRLRRRHNR
jgi:hypothetical protein